jgi:hypothetical protein
MTKNKDQEKKFRGEKTYFGSEAPVQGPQPSLL